MGTCSDSIGCVDHLARTDRAIEFGCGTGYMITYPMRTWGYDVSGVDIDATSVEYGQELLPARGHRPDRAAADRPARRPGTFDAIIASEVLEHLDDALLEQLAGADPREAPSRRQAARDGAQRLGLVRARGAAVEPARGRRLPPAPCRARRR